jgi:hypothetical protein
VNGSVIQWNGMTRTTTFVSSSKLKAAITAADIAVAGTVQITVFTPTPGGGISNAQILTIYNRVPTVSSLSSTSRTAGSEPFTLTVNGSYFVADSVVQWNGANRATTFVSSKRLIATITSEDIAAAGTAQVTVFSPAPGGGVSNARTFTINNPLPATTSLSPAAAAAGGTDFVLTVNGSNFNASSVVRWNGVDRITTHVSSTQLSAAIPAADIASAGTASVTVFNPAPGGGTSNAQFFSIN